VVVSPFIQENTSWGLLLNASKELSIKFPLRKKKLTAKSMLQDFLTFAKMTHVPFKLIEDPTVSEAFVEYERKTRPSQFKFGVMFCKEGQNESDMYNNRTISPAFQHFLTLLGDQVNLKAYPKYTGGLDTESEIDGTVALVETIENMEIIWHVASLMAYDDNDAQQLNRKRHIGNDIVVVVFSECKTPLHPTTFISHFNHIFIVVKKLVKESIATGIVTYRVAVSHRNQVPPFHPHLPQDQKFEHGPLFKQWLLNKCINAELACYSDCPPFSTQRQNLKESLLMAIHSKYQPV